MTFKPFRCGFCGALVKAKKAAGRTHDYRRGVPLPVPADFPIPTCSGCGEEYMSVEQARALEAKQAPAYAAWQAAHVGEVVRRLQTLHHVTLRQIEAACGVTGTYLSHVVAGRKEASSTLVYLLEAYALSPAEFQRRQSGGTWTAALAASLPTTPYSRTDPVPSVEAAAPEIAAIVPPLPVTPYAKPNVVFGDVANDVQAA